MKQCKVLLGCRSYLVLGSLRGRVPPVGGGDQVLLGVIAANRRALIAQDAASSSALRLQYKGDKVFVFQRADASRQVK